MGYKAFISYSHAVDNRLSAATQRALEQFCKSWYRRRSIRVFRDVTSLAITPELWPSIEHALRESEFFILIASPEAARSKWVDKEVSLWLAEKSPDTLLILLSAGDLTWNEKLGGFAGSADLAVPRVLQNAFKTEPRWEDLRAVTSSEHLSLRNAAFRDAIVGLSATLLGRERDDLDGEDLRRHRFTIRLAWATVLILIAATAIAIGNAVNATHERNNAIQARNNAAAQRNQALRATAEAEAARNDTVAANSQVTEQRNRAVEANQQRSVMLSRAYLDTGIGLLEKHNVPDAALWFAAALNAIQGDPAAETIPRMYLTAALEDLTLPEQILYHDGPVYDIAINTGGTRIATASDDRTVRVWDRDGNPLTAPMRHSGSVRYVAISPDGKRLATATQSIRMVMPQEGRLGDIFRSLEDSSYSPPAQDPNNPGNTAMVWDSAAGKPLTQAVHFDGPVLTSDFVPNGNVLSIFDGAMTMPTVDSRPWDVRTSGHTGMIWNAATGKDIAVLPKVNTMELSPDATRYAVGATDGKAYIVRDDRREPVVIKLSAPVVWVGFTSDSRRLLTLSDNQTKEVGGLLESKGVAGMNLDWSCQVWDADTGKSLSGALSTGTIKDARLIRFSPDGSRVAVARGDGGVEIWGLGDLKLAASATAGSGEVSALQFSADNRRLLVAIGKTAQVWDARTMKPVTQPIYHESTVLDARFGPGADQIITASGRFADGRTGSARIWDIAPRKESAISLPQDPAAGKIEFSPDGKSLLTSVSGEKARVISLAKRVTVAAIQPRGHLEQALYTPDGSQVVTSTREGTIQFWDLHGVEIAPAIESAGGAAIGFSPVGAMAAVAPSKAPASIRLWDLRTHRPMGAAVALGWEHAISLQFSPDGASLMAETSAGASGGPSSGNTVRIWRIESNRLLPAATLADTKVRWAAFSTDGKKIATTNADGFLSFWAANSGARAGAPTNLGGRVFHAQFLADSNQALLAYTSPESSYEEIERGLMSSSELAQLWDVSAMLPLGPPIRSDGFARYLHASPDGSSLIGANSQFHPNQMRFWDLKSGKLIGSGLTLASDVEAAALSSDRSSLAVMGSDKTIRIFDLHTMEWPAADLSALAEIVSGNKLSEGGYLKPVTAKEQAELLHTLRNTYAQWFARHALAGR